MVSNFELAIKIAFQNRARAIPIRSCPRGGTGSISQVPPPACIAIFA
jgi:hypothetical protein